MYRAQVGDAKVKGAPSHPPARSSCHGPTACHGPSGLTVLTCTSTAGKRVVGSEPAGSTHSSRVTCAARSSWKPVTQWMGVPPGRYVFEGVGSSVSTPYAASGLPGCGSIQTM